MNSLTVLAKKEVLRKQILEICNEAVPIGCSTDVLSAAFTHTPDNVDSQELTRQIDYLCAKGLVDCENVGNERLGLRRTVVKITATGIDYLEGNTGEITGIGG